MLPSPAWKTLPMRRRWRSAAAAMRAQDVGHARPRHDAVLRAVVRRQTADGAEGALAALPERGALGLVARGADLARAVRRQTRAHRARPAGRGPPPGRRARSGARRRRRSGARRGYAASTAAMMSRSIISSAAGTMPAAMMPETASLAASTDSKTASSVRYASGVRTRRSDRARDDAERPLGADDEPDQVVARAAPRPRRRASRPRPTAAPAQTPGGGSNRGGRQPEGLQPPEPGSTHQSLQQAG